jgi:hypothetical protein
MPCQEAELRMRIFFDTEFTGLTADAKLISIGLVDETGTQEFYAELADTYALPDCSAFCLREVIPHLEGGPARRTLYELRKELQAWLLGRGEGAVLVCDSKRDVVQINRLLPDGLPANVSIDVLGFFANWRRRLVNRGRRIHRSHGYRVHHALDDARVNRLVFVR